MQLPEGLHTGAGSNTPQRVEELTSLSSKRERNCTTSIQPAWLMRTDLCSCLGHLQNGCEAMANSLLVLMQHKQTHGAFSILKQIGMLSPDGIKAGSQKQRYLEACCLQPSCRKATWPHLRQGEAIRLRSCLGRSGNVQMRGSCSMHGPKK